ncbi:MAG: hypothetical protein GY754_40980 [bacterium]|nr:hypothetical protein [bacterium]
MKEIRRISLSIWVLLVLLVLAFSGCEAGLTQNDGSSEDSENKFSFSGIYTQLNEMRDEIKRLKSISSPVGSILAWHRDMASGTSIPEGWVLCNGVQINDVDSIFDGMNTPDLNGGGRFLRGGAVSGVEEDDMFAAHTHDAGTYTAYDSYVSGIWGRYDSRDEQKAVKALPMREQRLALEGRSGEEGDVETRPINMSVIWIMKIK